MYVCVYIYIYIYLFIMYWRLRGFDSPGNRFPLGGGAVRGKFRSGSLERAARYALVDGQFGGHFGTPTSPLGSPCYSQYTAANTSVCALVSALVSPLAPQPPDHPKGGLIGMYMIASRHVSPGPPPPPMVIP